REKLDDLVTQRRVLHWFPAGLAQEYGDRDTPHPLPRDAPIRPGRDHVGNPFLAPRGIPFDLRLYVVQRPAAKGAAVHGRVQRYEPLLRRAEDHWIVTPPAVRIRMLNLLRMQQHAFLLQQIDNWHVCVEYL